MDVYPHLIRLLPVTSDSDDVCQTTLKAVEVEDSLYVYSTGVETQEFYDRISVWLAAGQCPSSDGLIVRVPLSTDDEDRRRRLLEFFSPSVSTTITSDNLDR